MCLMLTQQAPLLLQVNGVVQPQEGWCTRIVVYAQSVIAAVSGRCIIKDFKSMLSL